MIDITSIHNSEPYMFFKRNYEKALKKNQDYIEAVSISSLDKDINEVNSRFVNLKKIDKEDWIFFSNYESPKAKEINSHKQISALFFWNKIGVQIRIKAKISFLDSEESDKHFVEREYKKNVLAISSNQSKKIESYEKVLKNYDDVLKKIDKNIHRPSYWGGFKFKPYYFEFWEGNVYRINRRIAFELNDQKWKRFFLEP